MLTCSLGWKVKSCLVILGSLKNFIGDYLSKLQHVHHNYHSPCAKFIRFSWSKRYCCNLSGGVALIVWFTTNGMCAKNKNICMWREQAIIEWSRWSDLGEWPLIMLVNLVNSWLCLLTVTTRVISSGDLYCCLLPRCEALRTCRSDFPIATIPYIYSKLQVIRLTSQIPQRHLPKHRLPQQGKTQISLHVRAIRSRATGARHRHRIICKSSLLNWKHWLSTKSGTHWPRPENLMRFVFDLLLVYFFMQNECFLKKSENVYETKIKLFSKRNCFCLETICEAKVFLKRK